MTDDGAARYKLVAIDLATPEPAHWRTVVPEGRDTLGFCFAWSAGSSSREYLHDAHSARAPLYAAGQVAWRGATCRASARPSGFQGRIEDHETYYSYSGFTSPPSVYRLDLG